MPAIPDTTQELAEFGRLVLDLIKITNEMSANNDSGEDYSLQISLDYNDTPFFTVVNSEGETEASGSMDQIVSELGALSKKKFVEMRIEDLDLDDMTEAEIDQLHKLLKKIKR